MKKLYENAALGKLTLKNRWIMLAMHMGYATENGDFSERDFAFYKRRAMGGPAAITIVGAVHPLGCAYGMHRLYGEEQRSGLKKMCDIIHGEDCKVFMQLFHSGRNNTKEQLQGKDPICPSSVPSPIYKLIPREMTEDDIKEAIQAFADAAKFCQECGVDCVEVSLSAGYLVSQFFSPRVNLRNDEWGGSEQKRMRFANEVLKAIRKAVGPDYTVIIKISGGDMLGGYDLKYMQDFIKQIPAGIIDGITVTGGWHEAPVPQISYHVPPGGFSQLAEGIKSVTDLPVIACNRINDGETAEKLLKEDKIDFAGAARAFMTDPDFADKVKNGEMFNKCQGCNKGCIERVLRYKDALCAFNPEAGREYLTEAAKAGKDAPAKVLVVGAGPVGLEAAKLFLDLGSEVTVVEKADTTGGKLRVASKPPLKQDLLLLTEYLEKYVRAKGGKIRLSSPVCEEIIAEEAPEFVILATGADPIMPKIPGIESGGKKVIQANDVLLGSLPKAKSKIAIIGGGSVGLETAEFLAKKEMQFDITVFEKLDKAGRDLGGLKWIMMNSLKKSGVKVLTKSDVLAVKDGKLKVQKDGEREEYAFDTLIVAVGEKPAPTESIEKVLKEKEIPFRKLGDADGCGNVMDGLTEAWQSVYGSNIENENK